MLSIPWKQEINFASALLLHSCITVFLKETSNSLAILSHIFQRSKSKTGIVLDGYTSVFSLDSDGELAELYFTNTGFILLLASLASAITMNLHLPIAALNTLIGVTFGLTFLASMLVACKGRNVIMPIMALRRAGRFIWSDTPFVNFFSLIYIAVVLKGASRLALRDYVVFCSIAILELIFMKARLAAADAETQQRMLRRLVGSEFVLVPSKPSIISFTHTPLLQHPHITPFTTSQRLFVMLYKTALGHVNGSLCGVSGPASLSIPLVPGQYTDDAETYGYRVYRISATYLVIEDCGPTMMKKKLERADTKERKGVLAAYTRFIAWTHGVLLRRLGRRRIVWLMRVAGKEGGEGYWKGNVNLVTGLKESWLRDRSNFLCVERRSEELVVREVVR